MKFWNQVEINHENIVQEAPGLQLGGGRLRLVPRGCYANHLKVQQQRCLSGALDGGNLSIEEFGAPFSVCFQAGGKYWKNADWYLGKHLASMGVKVTIELQSLVQAAFINSRFR